MKNILHQAFEDGPDRGFRNVGKTYSDAGGNTQKKTHKIQNRAKILKSRSPRVCRNSGPLEA
jgi:hypothetical protein